MLSVEANLLISFVYFEAFVLNLSLFLVKPIYIYIYMLPQISCISQKEGCLIKED